MLAIATWWMWRKPKSRYEKWLYNRPSLVSFRKATPAIYAELLLIRLLILAPQGVLLWICFRAFHLAFPIIQVLAFSPAILAATGAPLTPFGFGLAQVVILHGFSRFAPRSGIIVASVAFSVMQLSYRLPLGLFSAYTVAWSSDLW